MTFAEIERAVESKKRMLEFQNKNQAILDYTLADLIGRSVARIYNSSNKMPTLSEAYPNLFDKVAEEETIQQKKDELSALRFKQFVQSFNKNRKEVNK